jgi:nucleotide-binding universal stress UspA family protein
MTGINSIIVGVDGSDQSRAALKWAYDEAAHHGASLTVLTAWNAPVLPHQPPYGSLPPEGYDTQPANDAMAMIEKSISELDVREPAVEIQTSIEQGSPAKVLIERSKGTDLIVVGSRGRDGFVGMLLGSVSQHVIAHAHCPVTVVR